MNYHGLEIYFQSVGNADSIFVRYWDYGKPTNILIDGGRASHTEQVESFLEDRALESGDRRIHYLICSHSHDDHAGGLVELVKNGRFSIDQALVHNSKNEVTSIYQSHAAVLQYTARRLFQEMEKSEATRMSLLEALEQRNVFTSSPWAGHQYGPVFVLGPTPEFFEAQYQKLSDPAIAKALNQRFKQRDIHLIFESAQERESWAQAEAQKGLGTDPTSPENEVSTVLAIPWDGRVHLLTGDVGCEGLRAAIDNPFRISTASVDAMQIPHHGSRRNINEALIDHFAPRNSYISCKGSHKHPSRRLVNALIGRGSEVFATHYSVSDGATLRHHLGNVPPATEGATPLYQR